MTLTVDALIARWSALGGPERESHVAERVRRVITATAPPQAGAKAIPGDAVPLQPPCVDATQGLLQCVSASGKAAKHREACRSTIDMLWGGGSAACATLSARYRAYLCAEPSM